jgi:guanylate kinase
MATPRRGPLIIVSGPSGSGKSTLISRLVHEKWLPVELSVSATTREKRPGEVDGKDYHFWTEERFVAGVEAKEFLEHALVHGSWLYGTPKKEVEQLQEQGKGVLLDIDVQGAASVRKKCPGVVSIFVKPPSLADVEKRLRFRGTETEETIRRRVKTAEEEMKHVGEYTYVIVNDDLENAYAEFRALIAKQF